MKEKLEIPHRNRKVLGTLYAPEQEKFPLVIFSHGYNGHESDFSRMAEALTARGIGAFCFTFCGGSTRDASGFPTTEMTLFTEKEDLLAVVNELKNRKNAAELFLFGASMGGAVSALLAEEIPRSINGLILLFPALCIADDWNKRFPNAADIPERLDHWGMELGRNFFLTARAIDFAAPKTFEKPVMILHGKQDAIVPFRYAERASENYPNAELHYFTNEGHGFSEEGNEKVFRLLLSFLKKCTK